MTFFVGNTFSCFLLILRYLFQANYVKTHGLGGSMVWAMDLDDFNGACGLGNNPLMSKLKEVLSDPNMVTQPVTVSPSLTPTVSQTQNPTQASTQSGTGPSGGMYDT